MVFLISQRINNLFKLRTEEWPAVAWSFAYFFFLLSGYYVLRPVRDEMGIQAGLDNLPWLFTATFVVTLLMVPLFGWVSSKFARKKLLPAIYAFFVINILLFFILFRSGIATTSLAKIFFVWLSVFNLFVVSVFWSFMLDVFNKEQAKRLFGAIAAGGSLGAVTGPSITAVLVSSVGVYNLLLVSAAFISGALVCIWRLRHWANQTQQDNRDDEVAIKGNWWDGLSRVVQSSYLLNICLYVFLTTMIATFLYFIQAYIVKDTFADSIQRTQVFALIDLGTNTLTILLQLFVTGRIATRWSLTALLGIVPLLIGIGFIALGWAPMLIVIALIQIIRRAGNYALIRPGREMLFSVLPRTDRYKSKNFIDTAVYRGGDAVSGWFYAGLGIIGFGIASIAWIAVPVAVFWFFVASYLGRTHQRYERQTDSHFNVGGNLQDDIRQT